jgi:hypothetical protein
VDHRHGAVAVQRRGLLPSPLAGALAGALAAVGLLVVTAALRSVLGVRTLPETLAEGALFYLPREFFTYMITTFRGQAKVLLLYGVLGFVLLAGALVGLLYARWPRPRVAVGLGFALWWFTMLVALPASGEGLFGVEFNEPLPVMASYAAGWAVFSLSLTLFYGAFARDRPTNRGSA